MNTSYRNTANKTSGRVAGMLGIAIGATLMATVATMFDGASTMPWLKSTDVNEALLAPCGALVGTSPRKICTETAIAAIKVNRLPVRLAEAEEPAR